MSEAAIGTSTFPSASKNIHIGDLISNAYFCQHVLLIFLYSFLSWKVWKSQETLLLVKLVCICSSLIC